MDEREHTHDSETHTHEHGDVSHEHSKKRNHSHTHVHTKAVVNRLSRAIGHLNGVRSMVEDGRDCSEVLIQLAAVRGAISKTCEIILKDHLEHCIVDAIESDDMGTLNDLKRAVELLLK